MNDVVADLISQGVDLLITAVILSSIVTMMTASQNLNARISEQQAIHSEIVEYRQHNAFDNTEVYAQDVITAIMKYRGIPYVTVKIGGANFTWSSSSKSTNYSVSAIAEKITSDKIYKASLVRSVNGEVVGYEFVAK